MFNMKNVLKKVQGLTPELSVRFRVISLLCKGRIGKVESRSNFELLP